MSESKPERLLNKVKECLECDSSIRISNNGVPHLLVKGKDITYSVCYFDKTKQFKIFYPYPSSEQKRAYCPTYLDVGRFFKSKGEIKV